MYVISHGNKQGGERIEVFDIITDSNNTPVSLKYKHGIANEELNKRSYKALNSILVVESNKFYVTQWQHAAPPYGPKGKIPIVHMLENAIWPSLMVYFCEYTPSSDHLNCEVAADGFQGPNGITTNTDKSEVYVVDVFPKSVVVLSRDSQTNKLTKKGSIKSGACDNIKFDDDTQTIHCGALGPIIGYMQNIPPIADKPKPLNFGGSTEIFKDASGEWQVRDLVITNKYNAVSNSLRMKNTIILGTPFYDGLYICPLNDSIKYQKAEYIPY